MHVYSKGIIRAHNRMIVADFFVYEEIGCLGAIR